MILRQTYLITEEAKDDIRRQPWLAGFFIRKAREDVEKLLSGNFKDYVPVQRKVPVPEGKDSGDE